MSNLHVVSSYDKDAKYVRESVIRRVRESLGRSRDQAGYALVIWDKQGGCESMICSGGPVAESLVPMYVHDALNRHVAVNIAKREP